MIDVVYQPTSLGHHLAGDLGRNCPSSAQDQRSSERRVRFDATWIFAPLMLYRWRSFSMFCDFTFWLLNVCFDFQLNLPRCAPYAEYIRIPCPTLSASMPRHLLHGRTAASERQPFVVGCLKTGRTFGSSGVHLLRRWEPPNNDRRTPLHGAKTKLGHVPLWDLKVQLSWLMLTVDGFLWCDGMVTLW
jgi:hypothetical protein